MSLRGTDRRLRSTPVRDASGSRASPRGVCDDQEVDVVAHLRGRELDQPHARRRTRMRSVRAAATAKPRLADTSRSGEGDEPRLRDRSATCCDRLAAGRRSARDRPEGSLPRAGCPQRRERRLAARRRRPATPARARTKSRRTDASQVEDATRLCGRFGEQRPGRARHEHLPAVTGAHEPRAPAQREAEPVVTTSMSGAGVDGDATHEARARRPSRPSRAPAARRWPRAPRPTTDGNVAHKPVTGVLELDPAVRWRTRRAGSRRGARVSAPCPGSTPTHASSPRHR